MKCIGVLNIILERCAHLKVLLKAAGLLKYVSPFGGHQTFKNIFKI